MFWLWLILVIIGAVIVSFVAKDRDNSKSVKDASSNASENNEDEIDVMIEIDELDENGEPW